MEEFYRRWFELQGNDNPEYQEYKQSESESDQNVQLDVQATNDTAHVQAINDIVYENSELKLYVQRGVHKRQKIFKILDQMFYFRIEPKHSNMPKLSSILNFLHAGFLYILREIRKHFEPSDSNIAYLTLYQKPMINGLNTGSFDLQNEDAATEMTDRILTMLSQYLLSNQSLTLNESFQVYLKILSVDHMKHRETNPPR